MSDLKLPGEMEWADVDRTVLDLMATHLPRIDDLAPRLELLHTAEAPEGSIEAGEIADPIRAYSYDQARTYMGAAFDHLYSWRHLLMIAGLMPMYAHFTMLRTAHEASLIAYWLMEPGIDPDVRRNRGIAVQASNYEERKKFEDAAEITSVPPPAQLAVDRLATLMKSARALGLTRADKNGKEILAPTVPGTTDLFDKYEAPSGSGASAQFLWRLYSGFAHAKQWALSGNFVQQTPFNSVGRALALNQANEYVAAYITYRVIAALERALLASEMLRPYPEDDDAT